MMKKILAGLLASAMVVTALAACGSTPAVEETTKGEEVVVDDETEVEETEAAGDDEEAPAGDVVTIKIYRTLYNLGQVDTDQVKKVEDAINAKLEEKGATVRVAITEVHNSEYADKANLALANGEMNILWNAQWWGTIGTDDIWRANGAYDITDLLPGTVLYGSMDEGVWEAAKYDGKVLFIPVYKESYEGYDMKTRKALVDQYGWDFSGVKTVADLEPFVKEAYEGGVKYAFDAYQYFYRYYLDYYDFFGGESSLLAVNRETNEVENATTSDLYADWCKLMARWGEEGWISEDFATENVPSGLTQTQDWAFEPWTCVPGGELNNSQTRDNQEEVIIEGITGKYMHSNTALGSCYTITAKSTEAEAKACIEWLGLLYTDTEIADLYTYGIEGEDWEKDEEGKVAKLESAKYNHSAWESTSVVPLSLASGEPDDKVADYIEKNGAAATSCAAGFRFDKTPVEDAWAAALNLNKQYGKVLECGGYPEDQVDSVLETYHAELEAAGFAAVLENATEAYNAWKN